jgi:membrane-associated protein
MEQLIDIFLHLNKHINDVARDYQYWLYLILFMIVFCETGLVVTPFLPGDSLLFAAGALAATPNSIFDVHLMFVLLVIAAIAGDAVNYAVGHYLGPKVFRSDTSWLFNKKHLLRTQEFYEQYGGKTIIIARFVPIIRTFAPFVAGIGNMRYPRFALYNVTGGIAWVAIFLYAGYYFGSVPFVQDNFSIIVIAIILISVMPLGIEFVMARRRGALRGGAGENGQLGDKGLHKMESAVGLGADNPSNV